MYVDKDSSSRRFHQVLKGPWRFERDELTYQSLVSYVCAYKMMSSVLLSRSSEEYNHLFKSI